MAERQNPLSNTHSNAFNLLRNQNLPVATAVAEEDIGNYPIAVVHAHAEVAEERIVNAHSIINISSQIRKEIKRLNRLLNIQLENFRLASTHEYKTNRIAFYLYEFSLTRRQAEARYYAEVNSYERLIVEYQTDIANYEAELEEES